MSGPFANITVSFPRFVSLRNLYRSRYIVMGNTHRAIQGVIFDLDGLMIDSEPLSFEAWQRCLAPHGASLMVSQYRLLIGTTHHNAARVVGEWTGLDPEIAIDGFWEWLLELIGE